ncbi:hypothetical protein Pmani_030762 [Petrolisthes manimaculis]|uniref:Uncharacterized protein n=1 Tax=Petrolisthes manimaculis TaxID=1843537 RepID=A0AAE1NUZ5_9EUCA|nr:hypothetical protein Pmani_030762 [Petrolisthes manimaculis]
MGGPSVWVSYTVMARLWRRPVPFIQLSHSCPQSREGIFKLSSNILVPCFGVRRLLLELLRRSSTTITTTANTKRSTNVYVFY